MKRVLLLVLVSIISFVLISCSGFVIHEISDENGEINDEQISPIPESNNTTSTLVNLYYGYSDEQFLVCESRTLDLSENEESSYVVLNALINGPSISNSSFTSVINKNTQIVDISENENYLFITFSKEFLNQPEDFRNSGMQENVRRYLAVYSVIDTILEFTKYDYVQIFVDRDGTGSGSPITNEECGLDGNESFEPRGRNGSIILNESNTIKEIMNSFESKDWARLYDFVAYKDSKGLDRPSFNDFRNAITVDNVSISNSEVIGQSWNTDNEHSKVFVDFTISNENTQPSERTNVSIDIIRERSVWKITYDELLATFINI